MLPKERGVLEWIRGHVTLPSFLLPALSLHFPAPAPVAMAALLLYPALEPLELDMVQGERGGELSQVQCWPVRPLHRAPLGKY